MNVPLLRKIKAVMLARPKRVDMYGWLRHKSKERGGPVCGTVGCIAGWACLLSEKQGKSLSDKREAVLMSFPDYASNGADALGITGEQAERLFFTNHWPKRLADSYDDDNSPRQKARIVARRIDLFIRSKGRK